jgi:hypothetical protein
MSLLRLRSEITFVVLAAVAFAAGGCTGMRTISPRSEASTPVFGPTKAGDRVSVEMRDGRREKFVVSRVEQDELVSTNNARYRRADIVVLKRHAFSPVKTAILAAGIAAGAIIVAVAAAVGSALDGL